MTEDDTIYGHLDAHDLGLIEDVRLLYNRLDFVAKAFWVIRFLAAFDGHLTNTVRVLEGKATYGVYYYGRSNESIS